MPVSPHPVTITVYDTDGSTLMNGAKCIVRNCTKKTESSVATTNASGVAIIDLANLPLGDGQTEEYSDGDKCLIIAYKSGKDCHVGAYYGVTGSSKSQTLYLKEFPYSIGEEGKRIFGLRASNTHASTSYYIKIWAYDDAQLLDFVQIPTKNCIPVDYHPRGLTARSILEIENKAVMVTPNFK